MSCFVVPAAEAVITTVTARILKSKENKEAEGISSDHSDRKTSKISFSTKLGWLNKMLWGGSALLGFEHLWHGEIVPFFPFFTAAGNGETAGMLAEMGSRGVVMAVLVTSVWAGMLAVSSAAEKKEAQDCKAVGEEV